MIENSKSKANTYALISFFCLIAAAILGAGGTGFKLPPQYSYRCAEGVLEIDRWKQPFCRVFKDIDRPQTKSESNSNKSRSGEYCSGSQERFVKNGSDRICRSFKIVYEKPITVENPFPIQSLGGMFMSALSVFSIVLFFGFILAAFITGYPNYRETQEEKIRKVGRLFRGEE